MSSKYNIKHHFSIIQENIESKNKVNKVNKSNTKLYYKNLKICIKFINMLSFISHREVDYESRVGIVTLQT